MRKAVAFLLTGLLGFSLLLLPELAQRSSVRAQATTLDLRRIHPSLVTAGTRTFTVRLDGGRFDEGANVLFDGTPLASPRISRKGKFLLAEVDASLVANPGTHTVQGVNSDGASTPTLTMTVQAQDPDLQIRLVGNAVEEDSGLTLLPTLLTQTFGSGSSILVWGRGATTTDVNGGVQVEIGADLVNDPGEITITLVAKNGGISNTEIFFVVPTAPLINEVLPDVIEVGTEDVPLIVTGVFKAGATIFVNDVELQTTVGKNQRLEATLPASFIANPTQLVIRVEQDGVQSQDFIVPVTPTTNPFIYSISPKQIRLGEKKTSVEVIGANFSKKVTATIDGVDAPIRDFTKTVLTVAVPNDIAQGTHTVQISDADGNQTAVATFDIVPDLEVATVAGNGKVGFDLGCVDVADARFLRPRRLAFGPDGLLYVTDQQNHAIRSVDVNTGRTCTVVGTGEEGYNDSGNSAGKPPTLSFPNGVAFDSSGTMYITENGNCVIRRVIRSASGLTIDTFAGLFTEITDKTRQDRLNSTRNGIASYHDGTLAESGFRLPDDIVVAPDGSIYIADAGNSVIRKISQSGGQTIVETIAGNGVPGFADGAADRSRFNTPTGLALSLDGQFLYVADTNNQRIRRIDLANRRVSTFAGGGIGDASVQDGLKGLAVFFQPIGLAFDSTGTLYVSEFGSGDIRRIDPAGNVTTLAGGGGNKLRDGPGLFARFNFPRGLAIDTQNGILYIADYENFAIRKIALR